MSIDAQKSARFLGWFSLAMGLTEVFFTEELAGFLGTPHAAKTLRLFGLREIAAGAGILSNPRRLPFWLYARVAGDALDLASLALALPDNPQQTNVLTSIGAVAGVTALDVYTAERLTVGI